MTDRPVVMMADYAGHAFPYELSTALVHKGWNVQHVYCHSNVTPRGSLLSVDGVRVDPIELSHPFEKYSLPGRLRSEVDVGREYVRRLQQARPDALVTANMPVLSLWMLVASARRTGVPVVAWVQDIQAGLAESMLPPPARPLARLLAHLERSAVGKADRVVAISDALAERVSSWPTVNPHVVDVIENWAPVEDIVPTDRRNAWAVEHGLADTFNFLYSGTLGRKHQPELLLALAQDWQGSDPSVRVVVVSDSEPAVEVEAMARRHKVSSLVRLPFQPFERLSEVLGTGDVLVALLEPDASPYCVPSKVASYLCAGRPVLANIPSDNLAAELLTERTSAGVVTGGRADLLIAARQLRSDESRRSDSARSGRSYACAHYLVADKAAAFGGVLASLPRSARTRGHEAIGPSDG